MTIYYTNYHAGMGAVEHQFSGACFGGLNENVYPRGAQDVDNYLGGQEDVRPPFTRKIEGVTFEVLGRKSSISHINTAIYAGAREAGKTLNKHCYEFLQEIFNDIPFYQDFVDFDYLDINAQSSLNMRFDITDTTPADKVASAMFLARNLVNYGEGVSYQYWRGLGYTPLFSVVLAHMFNIPNSHNPFSRQDASVKSVGEYNWFHPQNLGMEGLVMLLSGEEPSWFLQPWKTLRGYRRNGSTVFRNAPYIKAFRRVFVDWATVIGDEEPILDTMVADEGGYFTFPEELLSIRELCEAVSRLADQLSTEYSINVRA